MATTAVLQLIAHADHVIGSARSEIHEKLKDSNLFQLKLLLWYYFRSFFFFFLFAVINIKIWLSFPDCLWGFVFSGTFRLTLLLVHFTREWNSFSGTAVLASFSPSLLKSTAACETGKVAFAFSLILVD